MENLLIEKKQLPSKNRAILYAVVVFFSFVFLFFLRYVINSPVASMSWNLFINIFVLIIGWNDIWKYLRSVDSYKFTFILGIRTVAYQTIVAMIFLILLSFVNINDPQGIKDFTYSLREFLYLFSFDIILTAIGEEFWKLLMILTVLRLVANIRIPIFLKLTIGLLIPSIIFGLAHNINYLNTAWIPIAAMTIPSFVMFLKYKSILPLIIAHFIFDFISIVGKVENFGNTVVGVIGVFLIIIYMGCEFTSNIKS